ncbi:DUF4365 domain-containing protein [Brevibacterium sp. VCM10]|uniref:DUF4365 domain-containing protein n=1 Tax=Brevibacterium sp. VCM10 TaxID=1381751 RepID=UPI000471D9EA|nr:DUF4365 domain-containing protein [Brevibacterium sp. VCM10]
MSPLIDGWDSGHTARDLTARKGRYGVAYVRDVCAHFGVGMMENSPDEDFNAIDLSINFEINDVRVQVKCTSKTFSGGGSYLNLPVKDDWVRKWSKNPLPAYLVAVSVPTDPKLWIDYDSADLTNHRTAAYWTRIDQLLPGQCTSIDLPKTNRFTPDTLREWNSKLNDLFEGMTP